MTIAFNTYIKHISPDVPGCPISVLTGFVRETIIDFCDRTSYWRKELSPIFTAIGQVEYLFSLPTDTLLVRVLDKAYYRGTPLEPVTEEFLSTRVSNWRAAAGSPVYLWMRSRNPLAVRLVPYPGPDREALYTSVFTANASNDQITVDTTNELYTGAMVRVSTVTTLPAPLAAGTDYFIIDLGTTTKKLATSLDSALNGVAINLTNAGTGVHTITQQGDLVVPVSLKPTMAATGADDSIYNDHWQTIRDGVLGRAMVMPNKPWTNAQLGAAHYKLYDTKITDARIQKNLGFVNADLRVEPRRFV